MGGKRASSTESSTDDAVDKTLTQVRSGQMSKALSDEVSSMRGLDALSGAQRGVAIYKGMTGEERTEASGILFAKGSSGFARLDENKNGAFSDEEIKKYLRSGEGTGLERTAAAHMLMNSERLSGGTGQITPESLNRESIPFALPDLALITAANPPKAGSDSGKPADATVKPTVVDATVKPTPVDATVKPTVVDATVKPTPADASVKPTPVDATVKPTPVDATVKPTVVDATVKPTVVDATVKPTVVDATVKPTVVDATVKPTPVDATVKPTVGDATVKPTVVDTTVKPEMKFQESALGTGAKIGTTESGDLRVTRTNGSSALQTSIDGKPTIVENSGNSTTTWTIKESTAGTADKIWVSNPPGQERHNMTLEKNGNLSYTQGAEKHIIRSNGAELIEGPGRASYNFDDRGRISWVNYADGLNSFGFNYKGDTETIKSVNTYDHKTAKLTTTAPGGTWGNPVIAPDGTYTQESYQSYGGKIFKGKQTFNTTGSDEINQLMTDGTVWIKDGYGKHVATRSLTDKDFFGSTAAAAPAGTERRQRTPGEMFDSTTAADRGVRDDQVKRTKYDNLNESTDTSFQLKGYMLPSPDQLGAGSCLYMSATGIAEYLLNKSRGIVNPQVGGPTDLSEQWTINLSKSVQLGNNYTDAPFLLTQGGTIKDSQMPFHAYADSSWMGERAVTMSGAQALPAMKKDVLFTTGGEGSQQSYGQMRPEHLTKIKEYLRTHESPVLFVYKPPTANWWHANIITGFDDKTQTFTVRDSSFGKPVADVPAYNYDGRSPYGPKRYLGETKMPYSQVLQWGNHATGYRLDDEGNQLVNNG